MHPTATTRLVPRPAPTPSTSHRRRVVAAVASAALFGGAYVTTEALVPAWLSGDVGPVPFVVPAACAFENGDRIALQADAGTYVSVANTTATVLAPDVAAAATWKVFNTGRRGTLALQAASGKFLARCRNTPAAIVDVDHWSEGAYAQWTCVLAEDGRIALQADTGKFLERDSGAPRVRADSWRDAAAQWAVDRLPVSPACAFEDGAKVGLQADVGRFMARCDDCIPEADAVFAHADATAPEALWTVYNTGTGKLMFAADNSKFLNREYKLVPDATVVDQAFTRLTEPRPWAEFTCVDLGNGKIALEADTGKFVNRCANCLPHSVVADSVAMNAVDARADTTAQWSVVRHT
ncbi:hypothetical protein ACHHYP_01981 [Achlya hypogyna]|uniref:Uncharacterized protein n=1 Tax=Achlya hypogyna TaxID=1202772 RepID=A0A1V9Z7K9_ACHHY|nr:hypothetical protein ACHHYP_01981 [Achlya hypogyna]